jgi:hypothetical protein
MPRGYRYVNDEVNEYVGALTADVEAKYKSIDRECLEAIDAAAAWHRHALFVLTVLRREHDKLTPETKVQFSAEIAKAIEKRTYQVKRLKLDDDRGADYWSSLRHVNGRNDTSVPACPGVQTAFDPDNAPQGECGADNG